MRILIISQYFWPEDFRINDLVKGLIDRNHEVTVLTGLPNYPKGRFSSGYGWRGPYSDDFHGAKVIRVPLVPRGKGSVMLALNYLSFMLTASLIGPWRCRGKHDVIFVYEPSPVTVGVPARIIARLKRFPFFSGFKICGRTASLQRAQKRRP